MRGGFFMDYKVVQKEIIVQSRGWIPTFHDISKEVMRIVRESGIRNGTCSVVSHHTTCSVIVQETSHDIDSFGLEYLQHDLLDIMRKLVPDYREDGQYRHPGPVHLRFGRYVKEPGDYTSLNTDAHLRSVIFGRSEVLTIKDGILDGGEFAHIYFVDWDQVRARSRQVNVTVMGTTEDVSDRIYNGGEAIDTLPKYTDEDKSYSERFDLQLKDRK
jgi:secondary thiamine-phosphate synthase enzyme